MQKHVNDDVLDISMSEIVVDGVCMKVMQEYLNGQEVHVKRSRMRSCGST